MATGLVALLDDISVIARAAAASVDDVGVAASRAGAKAAGVVIDDAAVTPSYVTGLTPDRELPIIARITRGSLINKLLILLPAALLLSEFFPWAITPVLMLGGCYLSYEGAEKVLEKLSGVQHGETLSGPIEDVAAFEEQRTKSAIRTDLILSAEIMAITLNTVAAETLFARAAVLAIVGVGITVLVYGVVAIIVKMDDIGLYLARKSSAAAQRVGRFLLSAMPRLLVALSVIGTIAMLWVGGGIILHGLEDLGLTAIPDVVHNVQHHVQMTTGSLSGVLGWVTFAVISGLVGLLLGTVIFVILHKVLRIGAH
ncbi:DUF808 domain-containing protein [Croceicoccus sp. F390]|uniref:DUF808 domain-containing protein n=1 Tax=Croceicoccus esteveae TaxID=3075597 RepID=A0ABU2ZEJ6_9SPHN|nr:DUF808 domain-containing protein [Croceicoccus sp. F390]MDT0574800.1 DUF808 domain-containing protein [Croceicoccus sp. F390]